MINHPNRSNASPVRFIAYSMASMNALAEGTTAAEAVSRATSRFHINDEFLVVAQVRSKDDLDRFDILPKKAVIIWRGSNDLAQNFRLSQLQRDARAAKMGQ